MAIVRMRLPWPSFTSPVVVCLVSGFMCLGVSCDVLLKLEFAFCGSLLVSSFHR